MESDVLCTWQHEERTRIDAAESGSLGAMHDYVVVSYPSPCYTPCNRDFNFHVLCQNAQVLLERICSLQEYCDKRFGDFLVRMYVNQQRMNDARQAVIKLEMASS